MRWVSPMRRWRSTRPSRPDGHRGGSPCRDRRRDHPPRNAGLLPGDAPGERGPPRAHRVRAPSSKRPPPRGRLPAASFESRGRPDRRPHATGAVGRLAGLRSPVGGARHQVAVSEPHPAFHVDLPMVFDVGRGLYWRLEDGGLLWGCRTPWRRPGRRARRSGRTRKMQRRLAQPAGAGDARPGAPEGMGGDDRLHARPPAHPRWGDQL